MTNKTYYLLVLIFVFSSQAFSATILIQDNDGPGEGFKDPTDATSIPAQAGNNPGATLGELRLNVFKEAAKVLGEAIKSNVTIKVGATFDPLACTASSGTLGQAGATSSIANSAGTTPDTAYVIALGESLAGSNINGSSVEINAKFNSDVDASDDCLGSGGFYYGLDGNAPAGMAALFAVVLHELSHGLGFSSLSDTSPAGSGGFIGAGGFPDSFSRNLYDQGTGKSWHEMTNMERKVSAVNEPKLVWKGAKVTTSRRMHLGPAPEFVINLPAAIAGNYTTVLGEEPSIVIPAEGVTAGVIDGNTFMDINDQPADGCSQIGFGGNFTGKIVMFDKSPDCGAAFPAFFSEFEGAMAVIIVATTASGLPDVSGQISNQEITIPYFGVSKSVGAALRNNLGMANVTIKNSATNLLGTRGGRLKMHGPAQFETGASVSHWSRSASPDLLMEPVISRGLVYKKLDLTTAALKDTGWTLLTGKLTHPRNVRATDGTSTQNVRVTWDAVEGATVYRVFRCPTADKNCGAPIGFAKTPVFEDKNGIAGIVYFYRVKACTATTCSIFSFYNKGFRRTLPAQPGNVMASDGSSARYVRITWDAVENATGYRVFRCLTKGATCGTPIAAPNKPVFHDANGVAGTVYFYRVRACIAGSCGKISFSNSGFRKTGPAEPLKIDATDGSSAQYTRVTWQAVAGITSYRVFRCLTINQQTCGTPIGFPKTTTLDDKKGIAGKEYFYRIRACMPKVCSPLSLANKGFRKFIPARPTNIRASDGTYPKRVRVNWNKVTGATVYRVFRCPTTGPNCGAPVGYPKNPVFDDFRGDEGVVYYYRIRACTTAACGNLSAQDPGHRGSLPSVEASANSRLLPATTAIPVFAGNYGRVLLILTILGMGMLLIKRTREVNRMH